MKRYTFSFISSLLTLVASGSICAAVEIDVYFTAGQSNAANFSDDHTRTGDDLNDPANSSDPRVQPQTGSTIDVGYNLTYSRFRNGDLTSASEYSTPTYTTNLLIPDLAVSQLSTGLHTGGNDQAIFGFARNGTPIDFGSGGVQTWYPGDDPANGLYYDDGLYGDFSAWASARLDEITNAGNTYNIKGLFWFQGENDATLGGTAVTNYQENFENLVYRFREDFGSDLAVVATEIREVSSSVSNRVAINQALNDAAASDPLISVVSTDGLTPQSANDVHLHRYTGYRELAPVWANAMLNLQLPDDPTPATDGVSISILPSEPTTDILASYTEPSNTGWQQTFAYRNADPAGTEGTRGRGQSLLMDLNQGEAYNIDAISLVTASSRTVPGAAGSETATLVVTVFEMGTEPTVDPNNTTTAWFAGDGNLDGDILDGTGYTPLVTTEIDISGLQFGSNEMFTLEFDPGTLVFEEDKAYGFFLQYVLADTAGLTSDVTLPFQVSLGTNVTTAGEGFLGSMLASYDEANQTSVARDMRFFLQGTVVVDGDYNSDGVVDIADYQVWKSSFGSTTELAADGNDDGIVDAADFTYWRDRLQATGSAVSSTPEPTTLLLCLSGIALAATRGRSRVC